ncbi:hypothetical protein GCM10023201_59400 [Actinomycetospora corticicola]|uniref:DUF6286 domain-containing protein n=1 Tax=Actinomycetospora corticicola TaxID=663602 RepID=A0A7Y9E2F8_9PSEU|nr:DUF6286 domain-containing protein [Actinomycetospora corticicola]NYD39695.1 hypothetical protein [Actinomycetospora corticicola]
MTRRPRRTVPALLVALVLLALGALAATSAIQTLLGRTPVVSLDAVPSALSGVAWESPAVLIAAGAAALVGLVLLLAAILPGPSHVLPLSTTSGPAPATTGDTGEWGPWSGGGVEEAGWHRHDLGVRLRRRAQTVEGVTGASATVRKRSIKVIARTHRATTDELRQAVESALSTDLDTLGLARRPRLRVSVSSTRKER